MLHARTCILVMPFSEIDILQTEYQKAFTSMPLNSRKACPAG
jgi:hypothetical protein